VIRQPGANPPSGSTLQARRSVFSAGASTRETASPPRSPRWPKIGKTLGFRRFRGCRFKTTFSRCKVSPADVEKLFFSVLAADPGGL
jgi:hypothetical protein